MTDGVDAPVDEPTRRVDIGLFEIEQEIDWLARVSPTDNVRRWEEFRDSDFRVAPPLTYPEFDLDVDGVRARLAELPLDAVGDPLLKILLSEKHQELGEFVDLLEARDTPAFPVLSASLFGGNDPDLIADARTILESVPVIEDADDLVGSDVVVEAAEAARERYRAQAPGFHFDIRLVPDADATMMVHHGDLVVDSTLRIPRSRVAPLVAHEVGVHVVTRHNGRRQPLRLFESGFAHYDVLQEGLATFCEHLAGNLPAPRLRVLAARVVAADLALAQEPIEEIFRVLHDDHGMLPDRAFDVAVRAKRGGGLTKDAVYLAGLRDVLAWLADGGDVTELFVGKFSLHQRHVVSELLDASVLRRAEVLPTCLVDDGAEHRLNDAIATPVTELYHDLFHPVSAGESTPPSDRRDTDQPGTPS